MTRRLHNRGFTLLEILVVIVIIGIMASVAMLSVGVLGRDSEMKEQAERLGAVLDQVKEDTELKGINVGVRIGRHGYDFFRYDARRQTWLPIDDDDLLAPRELPDGLSLRLWLEGREVVLQDALDSDAATATKTAAKQASRAAPADANDASQDSGDDTRKTDEHPPQIMVLASGDINSFELQFDRDGSDAHWKVASQPDNSIVTEELHET